MAVRPCTDFGRCARATQEVPITLHGCSGDSWERCRDALVARPFGRACYTACRGVSCSVPYLLGIGTSSPSSSCNTVVPGLSFAPSAQWRIGSPAAAPSGVVVPDLSLALYIPFARIAWGEGWRDRDWKKHPPCSIARRKGIGIIFPGVPRPPPIGFDHSVVRAI